MKTIQQTPLEALRKKIIAEKEQKIKQRITAEKDQIYDEEDQE